MSNGHTYPTSGSSHGIGNVISGKFCPSVRMQNILLTTKMFINRFYFSPGQSTSAGRSGVGFRIGLMSMNRQMTEAFAWMEHLMNFGGKRWADTKVSDVKLSATEMNENEKCVDS